MTVPIWAQWPVRRGSAVPWATVMVDTAEGQERVGVVAMGQWAWAVVYRGQYSVWRAEQVRRETLEIEQGCGGVMVIAEGGEHVARREGDGWEEVAMRWIRKAWRIGARVEGL